MSNFLTSFLTLLCIYLILTTSLSLLVGHTGIFSMAHAGLYGLGAYTSAIVTVRLEWPFLAGMTMAVIIGATASALMAIPSLRVSGDFFIVASLGMQVVIETFLRTATITGGEAGFRGIERPEILGVTLAGQNLLIFSAGILLICIVIMFIVIRSPYGRTLHAIRTDESVVEAVGRNVKSYKVSITILAGSFAALAGCLYAHHMTFLSPRTFNFSLSIYLLLLLLVGGRTRLLGVALGTTLILALPELLKRGFDLPSSVAGPMYQVVFAGLVIGIMFVRPQGILGARSR